MKTQKFTMYKWGYLIIVFFVVILFSCNREDEINSPLLNHSIFYSINNILASERLLSIMYSQEDSTYTRERFKIVHISDLHLSTWSTDNNKESPYNLQEAVMFANQSNLKINTLVATGDFVGNELQTKKQEAINNLTSFIQYFYKSNKVPSFTCLGNHDSNMLSTKASEHISKKELYNIFQASFNYPINKMIGENYYYADIPTTTQSIIRIIALDMTDQNTFIYDTQHYAVFSQKQIDWLCQIALQKDMTNNHSIIILNHYPFQPYSKKRETFLCDGDFVHQWNMIPEIIEAFRKKEKIEYIYTNKFIPNSPIHVHVDFSTTPGEFICYLGGHAHITSQFQIKGLSNQSPLLPLQNMLLCTNQSPSEIGLVYNKVQRQNQSIDSNSFCIYAIDTIEKKIYITFFGAYKPHNSIDYPEVIDIKYL
ncbi:hypothetical protein HMPREF1212_01393 [Parabacteroides sp. HGS0025]|uniref:metallophosphoesterase family protein n=1 Tax=Parabacteroides sp. HGS0025 TaxID=1078087 RepID=UPI0006173178|nr:metallophosphoesterase [Parabacteroides sp. HGS0025]KKB50672.1 hypothetical protein HMPREF1212_01393 [Parabacteroides sp. HGS0025]